MERTQPKTELSGKEIGAYFDTTPLEAEGIDTNEVLDRLAGDLLKRGIGNDALKTMSRMDVLQWDVTMKLKKPIDLQEKDKEGKVISTKTGLAEEPQTITNRGFRAYLRPRYTEVGTDTFLSQASPIHIRTTKPRSRVDRSDKLAVDIPDLQWGYRRLDDGSLVPTHDPAAVDLALQIIKDLQPDKIILGGDELDLPEIAHFKPDSKQMINTTQLSIDGLHHFLAQLRQDNQNAEIRNLTSNHIKRLGAYMLQNALPLFGIKRAEMAEDFPVMSYPFLLRLDELDIDYEGGYPGAIHKINDRLYTFHGDKVNNYSTAAEYVKTYDYSVLFHHDHRHSEAERTLPSGRIVQAIGNGCLCKVDGAVPSFGNSVGDKGEIDHHQENWQQGIGIIEYNDGNRPFAHHHVGFSREPEGLEARINGKIYRSSDETARQWGNIASQKTI